MKVLIISVMILSFFSIPSVSATTFVTKSGKAIEGEILEKTDEYIKVQTKEQLWELSLKDLNQESRDSIEHLSSVKSDNTPGLADISLGENLAVTTDVRREDNGSFPNDQLVYDEELMQYGIQFAPPNGWKKIKETDPYAKYVFWYGKPDGKAMMAILLPISINHFHYYLSLLHWRMKTFIGGKREEKINFLKEPCSIFTWRKNDKQYGTLTTKHYVFYKKGKGYQLFCTAPEADFDMHLLEFQKALETFNIKK